MELTSDCMCVTDNSGLSEGLLSLVLRVLDGAEALQEWLSLGAVEVVCDNLVRTSDGPSTVSVVMQHLSLPLPLPPHNKKTADIASGLLNFAPFGKHLTNSTRTEKIKHFFKIIKTNR